MNTFNGSARPRSPRTDAAQRAKLLAAFDQSGLSAAAFARQQALSYTTFCAWRQKRNKTKSTPAFVQIALAAPAAPVEVVVEVGAHARMRLHCESQIGLAARLLQQLNMAPAC